MSPRTRQVLTVALQQAAQGVIMAYLDAKDATGQYQVVVPVILLVPSNDPSG